MLTRHTFMVMMVGVCAFAQTQKQGDSRWSFLGTTGVARTGACAVSLNDGRLLIAGGGPPGASRGVELLDATGGFKSGAALSTGHARHSCTLLLDGKVLVTGGFDSTKALDAAELYDPATDEWTPMGTMMAARMGHSATLLADGRVLIAGGETAEGILNTVEVFDPATARFTIAGAMTATRKNHAAVLLEDGRVLIAGGANEAGSLSSLELFDPSTGTVAQQGELLVARSGLSATRLANGTVLLAGGTSGPETLDSAEIFDLARGTTVETASMMHARSGHMAFLLPGSGEVLLAGGDGGAGTAELFSQTSVRSTERQASAAEAQVTASAVGGVVVKTAAGTGAATLDQCANGPAPALGQIGTTCVSWVNGNLNSSKASYREGDAVAYRLRMSGVPTVGSNTVTIEWDTTQSGKHALDYLTRYNLSVTGADPCVGGICTLASSSTFPIPLDPNIRDDVGQPLGMIPAKTQMPGQLFTIWGGTITGVSAYTKSGEYSGNSATSITITFTASTANPVIAWGGHIATRVDWGAIYSAVAINGSPFHTRLVELNGGGGNQDRALSNDAAQFPASILVTKSTNVPTADNAFTFTSSPGLPDGDPAAPVTTFTLPVTINGQQSYARLFDKIFIASGTVAFTLSETQLPAGWTLQSIRCVKLNTTEPVATNGNSVTVNLTEGDSYSCTFTNAGPVAVSVTKACVPTDDAGQFTMAISGTTPASETLGCGGTMSRNVAIGSSVSLTESGSTLGNYTTTINCGTGRTSNTSSISFTMPSSAVSCTVTNTRKSYDVTVSKVCLPANDPGRFVLQVNGSGSEVGCSSPGNTVVRSVVGGQPVEVKELAGTGTLLSDYVSDIACTGLSLGGTGLTRTFTMPDSAVACTVTNRKPSISITKTCKTGLNASLAVRVTSTGQVCNTGGVDLTGLSLTDVQIIGEGTGVTGSVTFDTATLAAGACRSYTSTFTPTAASSGSCSPDDAACTIAFTDKVTVTASGGGVTVSDNKTATCSLCK